MGDRWWPTKIQVSGTGLAIVSTIAPTLGIGIPFWLRWTALGLGVWMLAYPIVAALFSRVRSLGRDALPIAIGIVVSVAIVIGVSISYFLNGEAQSTSSAAPRPQLFSTTSKMVFRCSTIPSGSKNFSDALRKLQSEETILGEAIGFAIYVMEMADGSVDVIIQDTNGSANTTRASNNRIEIIARKMNEIDILVTVSNFIPTEIAAVFDLAPLSKDPSFNSQIADLVRKLFSTGVWGCELF